MMTLAIAALVIILGAGCAASNAGSAARKRSNIIFIFTDDHGTQAIGAYGSRVNETPNIDRIARPITRPGRAAPMSPAIAGICRSSSPVRGRRFREGSVPASA